MSPVLDIKMIKSLSLKKFRDEYGLFAVEGEKMVGEALDSGFEVVDVLRVEEIGEKTMSRISSMSSPSPCLAVLRKPADISLGDLNGRKLGAGLYLALDSIRDPGNLGTILRTADWFGIEAVFASPDTVDIFNPKVVQSTMGAIFRVRFHYCDIPSLCRKVREAGGKVFGTFLDGDDIYAKSLDSGKERPSLVITGNESNGISAAVAKEVTDRLYIPSYSRGKGPESLNAAVATAVTLAEFRRK